MGNSGARAPALSGKGVGLSSYTGILGDIGVPREQKLLKGHLPRAIYLQVY